MRWSVLGLFYIRYCIMFFLVDFFSISILYWSFFIFEYVDFLVIVDELEIGFFEVLYRFLEVVIDLLEDDLFFYMFGIVVEYIGEDGDM